MLDRWSSYTVTIVWKFAWADTVLVTLDEWSSYRNGHLKRFDCIIFPQDVNSFTLFRGIAPWTPTGAPHGHTENLTVPPDPLALPDNFVIIFDRLNYSKT